MERTLKRKTTQLESVQATAGMITKVGRDAEEMLVPHNHEGGKFVWRESEKLVAGLTTARISLQ